MVSMATGGGGERPKQDKVRDIRGVFLNVSVVGGNRDEGGRGLN